MHNYRKVNRKTILKVRNKTPHFPKLPKSPIKDNPTINLLKLKATPPNNQPIKTLLQTKITKSVWLGTMHKWGANNVRLHFYTTPI